MNIYEFKNHLISDEKLDATISKYIHDVTVYIKWLDGREVSKELTINYKEELERKYEAASVNTILSSLNSYFDWLGHPEYKVKNIKIQKDAFADPNRELTKEEYERLLKTAYEEGKYRIYYVMQTICSCGIRVSELRFITVEAIRYDKCTRQCGTSCDPVVIGEYRGFTMILSIDTFHQEHKMTLQGSRSYTLSLSSDVFGNIQRIDNAIANIPTLKSQCENKLKETKDQFEIAKVESKKEFPQEAELAEKL